MRFSVIAAFLAPALIVSAQQTFTITVGGNGTNTFSPTSKNHTATQSSFATPCQNLTNGVDSGFMPVQNGSAMVPQWSFTMNNASAPLWFYCRQTGHCQQGMVFAVNPTPQKSFAMFQQAAMASSANGSSSASGSATSSTGTPSAKPTENGVAKLGGSSVGLLAVVGLVAGMIL